VVPSYNHRQPYGQREQEGGHDSRLKQGARKVRADLGKELTHETLHQLMARKLAYWQQCVN
jgi:hypothetical protein